MLGWPPDAPRLDLDHERFAYAGKFVTGRTGKVVARDAGEVVGAVAVNADRAVADGCRIRYVTVRDDRQSEGIGPRLLTVACRAATDRGYETVRIGVNNPFAFEAAYRAGFEYTGETAGMAELVLTWPAQGSAQAYRRGLTIFAERDLEPPARRLVERGRARGPPDPIPTATGADHH